MGRDIPKSDKTTLNAANAKQAQDFDDQQAAIAGRSTGRILPRLGQNGPDSQSNRHKKHGNTAELLSNLQLMMQDREYAALYNDVSDLLDRAETATELALAQSELNLTQSRETLNDTVEGASKLPDGTSVFKDASGNVWTADGRLVDRAEAESVVWKDGALSYEDYLKQKEGFDVVRLRVEELRHYQIDVLGGARDRLEDEDNPPSKDELEGLKNDIESGLEQTVDHENIRTAERSNQPTSDIELPELGS